jgi:hypothetical protein
LQISAEIESSPDDALAAYVESAQATTGYRTPFGGEAGIPDESIKRIAVNSSSPPFASVDDDGLSIVETDDGAASYSPSRMMAIASPSRVGGPAVDFSALHPSQRPITVVLLIGGIVVEYKGQMRAPRAVSVLFPLPYEDSNAIPDRAKIVRQGTLMALR